jgi:hypothetical protein
VTSYDNRCDKDAVTIERGHGMSAAFERYIGIDYSGAETRESSLKRLRVYMAIARPSRASRAASKGSGAG